MVHLRCSCFYSSDQNILIGFKAIDTLLLGWGTFECNYSLLNHLPRNCWAHKTVYTHKTVVPNTFQHLGGGIETQEYTPPRWCAVKWSRPQYLFIVMLCIFSPFCLKAISLVWSQAWCWSVCHLHIGESRVHPWWNGQITTGSYFDLCWGLMHCSRVPRQCSKGVLAPPYQLILYLLSWTRNLQLFNPGSYRRSCPWTPWLLKTINSQNQVPLSLSDNVIP